VTSHDYHLHESRTLDCPTIHEEIERGSALPDLPRGGWRFRCPRPSFFRPRRGASSFSAAIAYVLALARALAAAIANVPHHLPAPPGAGCFDAAPVLADADARATAGAIDAATVIAIAYVNVL